MRRRDQECELEIGIVDVFWMVCCFASYNACELLFDGKGAECAELDEIAESIERFLKSICQNRPYYIRGYFKACLGIYSIQYLL
jgi:hypothetical protein